MATIERRYLAPLNPSATIADDDRSKVYDIIRKELGDVLMGSQSYYPDGVQKDSQTLASDLNGFIAAIRNLQSRVDDPSNILGTTIDELGRHAKAFQEVIEKGEPIDNIEIPKESSPTTKDDNVIYVDPFPGPYSRPNPVSPNRRTRDFSAFLRLSDDVESGETVPDIYGRLLSRLANSATSHRSMDCAAADLVGAS